MIKKEATTIAKALFENHTVDQLFITKDGQAFFNETSANNHQQSFKTADLPISVTRSEAEGYVTEADEDSTETTDTMVDEATGKEVFKKPVVVKSDIESDELTDEEKEAALADAASTELTEEQKAAAIAAAKKKKVISKKK